MATAPIFQPPPTYQDPIIREGDRWVFNPVWLNWLLLLVDGVLGGTINHADLAGLQGGAAGQYYHLSLTQYNNVYVRNTGLPFPIVVGASPFLYHNTNAFDVDAIVTGGAGVVLTFSRDNVTFYALPATGMFHLSPGDYLNVVHAGAPTVTGVPR